MGLKLTPKFNRAQLDKMIKDRKDLILQLAIRRMQRVGETFVNNARTNGNYKDHTGNLRSSIGYVILQDGVQLFENFNTVPGSLQEQRKKNKPKKKAKPNVSDRLNADPGFSSYVNRGNPSLGLDTDTSAPKSVLSGASQAMKVIEEIAVAFPSGIVLIVVAGMEYAAAVESKNFDVITSSSLIAEDDLVKSFQALAKNLESA